MIYEGNLKIEKDDRNDYSGITEITGYLSIDKGTKVNLSAVQTIGGSLYIDKGTKVNLSSLQTIGGSLSIDEDAKVNLSSLQTIGGSLSIDEDAKVNLSSLQTIGGSLSIHEDAKVNLSSLQTIGGSLSIHEDAKVNLSSLQTIGGYLYIDEDAKVNLSSLQTIGGSLSIDEDAKVNLSSLQTIGGSLSIHEDAKVKLNKDVKTNCKEAEILVFNSFLRQGYLFADRILTKLISTRTNKYNTVYKTQKIGSKDIIYVVQKGDKFAHGETIKEAKKSLIYKISDRDTTRFKGWTLDTKVNLEDAVASYISITGACARGTKMFVDSLNEIPKIITPRVIIELTEGQYECDVYRKFFKGV